MSKIILAADHGGFDLKESVKAHLLRKKIKVIDFSPTFTDGDDYPDVAIPAAEEVARSNSPGVFFCGSGQGVCMTANKVKGVRAALAYDVRSVIEAKADDNVNVICMAGRRTKPKDANKMVDRWLITKFKTLARYARRVKKLSKYESSN
jgi:ribose 5-phosphate isomerase B